jgi:hypothetical protein
VSTTALTSINVSTTSGNLTLGDDIAVTGTGTDAMIFNAGSSTAAGTSTGGNIIISSSPTFTTGSGGRMTYYTGSISGSTGLTSLIGSGSNRFRYNSDETTTNYSAALSSGKYAIYREQPTLTITADDETVTYGTAPAESVTITGMQNGDATYGTAFTVGAGSENFTSSGLVNSETIGTITIASDDGATNTSSVGTYNIVPSAATDGTFTASNYNITYANGTLTVAAKDLTITANNGSATYGTAFTVGAGSENFTSSGLVNSETIGTITIASDDGATNTSSVGTYNIVPSAATDGTFTASNYNITYANGTLTVAAKDLTITANNGSATYGTAFTVGAGSENFTSSGLVNSETIGTITIASDDGATNTSSVGTYNIVPSAATDGTFTASNYNITYANGTLTVAAKDLTITANNGSATYGTAFTVGAGSENFTSSGLVNSETIGTITIASDDGATNTSSVGTYNIVPSAATDGTFTASNYNITYANGTLTVAAKDLTITANNGSATYGTAFTVGAGSENFTSSGLVNSETIGTITIASDDGATNTSSVGTYNIVPSAATDGTFTASNYNITYANGTLTVAAKDLTITASASNKVYDGNTTAAVTLTFTGLVGSETLGQTVGATFADKNVANAKTVTVNSITLSDGDNGGVASNYSIATGQTTTANITQLSSVTWNGNAGDGLWSSAANWVGSAIPDLNNVATAVIPSAQSVTFDSDTVGTIGSTITNNGTLTFNGATNYTFGQVISGSGALVKINTNTLTLSATNTFSGDTTISNGTIKLTGAVNAATDLIIASGATLDLQSTQTFASLDLDGTISRSTGSSELTITGTSDIGGSITTSGTQDYEGAVTVTGNSTLTTTSAQITFDTTVNSETGETNNLTITASEVQFDGIVGGTRTLGVISITGSLDLNAAITNATSLSVSTTSNLGSKCYNLIYSNYTGAVTLSGADRTLTGSTVNFGSTLAGGTNGLTITGNLDLDGAATGLTTLSVSGTSNLGANVTTSSTQTYSGALTLSNDVVLTTTNGNITFGGTVNSHYTSSSPTIKFYNYSNASGLLYTYTGTLSGAEVGSSCTFCNWGFNDTLTSFTLTAGGYVVLYQHGGLSGWSQVFDNRSGSSTATYNLPYGNALDNDASSFTISGGASSSSNYDLSIITGNNNTVVFQNSVGNSSALGDINITGVLNLDAAITNATSLEVSSTSNLGADVTTSSTQTYTGAVTLSANTTLTSTGAAISTSTIDGGYSLTISAGAAQSLTSAIGSSTPLTSINVSTTSGNLTLGDDITVTSTGTDAMIFNAGSSTAAGTSTGGNIIISGSPTFTTGSGGRMTYYTGSISGSTGLTSLIGSGSHRFRYNSDETTTNYSAALSSGKYAIYREQPTLTITADNETVTYSTAPSESVTITGTQNGDASATVVTTAASISIGGDTSTSNNYIVGGHTITPSAAASTYGYGFSYSTGTLTVDAKALTIAGITASNKTYNGNATATIDASAATFTGLVDGDAVTVSATGTFDNKNVGTGKTVTLTETNAGDDVGNYSITDQGTTTANITAKTLTATASASNKVYDGTTTATATLTLSGLVGSETLGQSVGATFADQNVNTGIVVTVNSITLSDGDNGGVASNYSISTGQTTTANITAKDLTITANNGSATYGTAFTVGAGSENFTSSGLVNSETIGTITIASDDGATNTSSVGTYNIVPSAATDGTFTASNYNITYANGTLTVAAKDLTITANNGSATYGTAFTVGAGSENFTSSGLVNSETIGTITIASDDGATNTSSVGTYNIVPSAATDGTFTASNYNITYANGTLTVAAKDLTITANNGSATYGTAFTVGAGSENFTSSGLVNSETIGTITIASDDGATNTSSVGTYNIVPSAATDGTFTASNYNITYANGTLTVAAKDLTITANNGSATYGTAFTVGAGSENFTSSGLVNSETIGTITIASDDGATNTSSVGTYNIVPSAATDGTFTASNYNITYANGTLTVAAKDLTITANNGSATYGTAFTVGAGSENFTSSGLVNSETIGTITIASDDGATNTSSVGTYNIVPSAATDGTFTASNYNITYANGTLTVAAKDLTITANNGSATYGTAFTVGAGSENFTSSGLVNSETIGTITIASDDGATNTSSVGTYNIVPSAATDGTFTASNYNITYANGTLTVAAKDLTITANNGSATYGTAFTVGAGSENFTSSGLVNSETIGTITIASDDGATNTSSVGTYNIVPSAATDGTFTASNYNITYANGTLTVAAKDLTITANNGSATYGTAFTVGAGSENFTSSGLVNSETIGTITIASDDGATNTSSVGTYNIVPSAATDGTFTASNYNITYANGTLTVAAKDLTITANNGSATYGTAFTVGAGSENFTSSGLVNSETIGTITIASDDGATNTSSVGTYNIVPSAATDGTFTASNYNITYANGTLTVAAKDLTITANNGSATYGTAFTVGAGSENFTSSGLVNSETIGTITIASDDGATNTSSVGTYNIVLIISFQVLQQMERLLHPTTILHMQTVP